MTKRTILITILAIFLAISFVTAAQPLPHAFEGKIIAKDGTETNMKTITAKINGVTTAIEKINNDSYAIIIIDNTGLGGQIEFFIGEEKATTTYSFKAFEVTKADLIFNTIPDETTGSCGDGICAVEECSFCAIDCPVSKCLNNNVCDTAIGEDYMTAPSDCIICGDGTCNGGETCSTCAADCGACSMPTSSGSGGGSGGGGSGYNPKKTLIEEQNQTISNLTKTNDNLGIGIATLNENIEDEVIEVKGKNKFLNWITGHATIDEDGNYTRNNVSPIIITIILVLSIGIYVFYRGKRKRK